MIERTGGGVGLDDGLKLGVGEVGAAVGSADGTTVGERVMRLKLTLTMGKPSHSVWLPDSNLALNWAV